MLLIRSLTSTVLVVALSLAGCADFGGPMNGSPDNLLSLIHI